MSESNAVNLEADAAGIQVEDSGIKRVAALAEEQLQLEKQMEGLDELQRELAEQHKAICEGSLPDAMTQAGVTEFKLLNGAKVTVKQFYSGKIADDNRVTAFNWLRDNDFGDLIKHELTVPLGRGNEELANKIKMFLQDVKAQYVDKEAVHHSTLNAFIKEQVEAGANFPMKTFNAYVGRRTKIKL